LIYTSRILDDELIGKYEIFDTTSLLLSNNPSYELISYSEKKLLFYKEEDLKKDLRKLINMMKINL